MPEEPTPERLWAMARKGDRTAFDELYERLAPPVLGMLMHLLDDREAAEEILAVVLERLWIRPGWERGSLPVQVALMSRHAAIGRLRERASLAQLDGAPLDSMMATSAWLPESGDAASVDERKELLKRVVKQLPESQRRALEMVVFEGYTEAEIAEKMAIPLGRAKAELRAAMRFLRHRLQAVMGTWAVNI